MRYIKIDIIIIIVGRKQHKTRLEGSIRRQNIIRRRRRQWVLTPWHPHSTGSLGHRGRGVAVDQGRHSTNPCRKPCSYSLLGDLWKAANVTILLSNVQKL